MADHPKQKRTPKPGRKRPLLTDAQVIDAVARWQAGESLSKIAKEYEVSNDALAKYTRASRTGKSLESRRMLTPEQISEVVQRWKSGAPLAQIAADYGVSHDTLVRYTRKARAGKRQARPADSLLLSPEQIAAAMNRLDAGETLAQIAQSYGVSYSTLQQCTQKARASKSPGIKRRSLRPDEIKDAMNQLAAGKAPEEIAKRYKVSLKALQRNIAKASTKKVEIAQLTDKQLSTAAMSWKGFESSSSKSVGSDKSGAARLRPLTVAVLTQAAIRWHNGDALTDIASAYNVSKEKLTEAIMVICWKCGVPLEQIAAHFNKSKVMTREIIKGHVGMDS